MNISLNQLLSPFLNHNHHPIDHGRSTGIPFRLPLSKLSRQTKCCKLEQISKRHVREAFGTSTLPTIHPSEQGIYQRQQGNLPAEHVEHALRERHLKTPIKNLFIFRSVCYQLLQSILNGVCHTNWERVEKKRQTEALARECIQSYNPTLLICLAMLRKKNDPALQMTRNGIKIKVHKCENLFRWLLLSDVVGKGTNRKKSQV